MPIISWPGRTWSSILNWWRSRALRALLCRRGCLGRGFSRNGDALVFPFEGPGEHENGSDEEKCHQHRSFQSIIAACNKEIAVGLCLEQGREGRSADPEAE